MQKVRSAPTASRTNTRLRCGNRLFRAFLYYQQRSIYQDRLGTNLGKVENRGVFLQARDALIAAVPQAHKDFLKRLLWVYDSPVAFTPGRLVCVHAGLLTVKKRHFCAMYI
jgi:hypothetical protein